MSKEYRLQLRPSEPTDAENISNLRNSGDWRFLHDAKLYSITETRKWLENMGLTSRRFIIELTDGHVCDFIGVVRIDHIDHLNRNCYVGMDIHPKFRGNGYSQVAYKLLIDYLFRDLNYNVLYLEVLETNTRAIHVYEKLGFVKTGSFPFKVFRDGKYVNSLIYTLHNSVWSAKRNSLKGN